MRFNDKLLSYLSQGASVIEGRLNYKKVGGNLPPSGFKERWFKLRLNVLFYFNLSEVGTVLDLKPAGAMILENCTAVHEMFGEAPFTFSLKFADDKDKKHVFSCRTEESVNHWVMALNSTGCDKLRRKINKMKHKLALKNGQAVSDLNVDSEDFEDPFEEFPKKPSFKSYIDSNKEVPSIQQRVDFSFFEDHFINGLGAIGQISNNKVKYSQDINDISFTVGGTPAVSNVPPSQPHRKAPDPPKRPPRNIKPNVSSSKIEDNLIQF